MAAPTIQVAAVVFEGDGTQTAAGISAASPALTGTPTAPTAALGTDTTQLATTAFVQDAVDDVVLDVATELLDYAPLASPVLTGTPTAPTAAPLTGTTQVATTEYVDDAVDAAVIAAGAVTSVFGRSGAVVAASGDYAVAQVTGAAPLASPTFTGTPAAPTAAGGTNTTQLATTAFVQQEITGLGGGSARPSGYDYDELSVRAPSAGTTLIASGTGAASAAGAAAASADDDGNFVQYTSAAGAGGNAGVSGSANSQTRRAFETEAVVKLKTAASVADVGLWAALASATPDNNASPAVHLAGMRYYTDTDGTAFWRAVTIDGTTATVTATALAVAADTAYRFRIVLGAGDVTFYSTSAAGTDTLLATHTTNLPGSSQTMIPYVRQSNRTATAKAVKFGRYYVRHKA